MDRITKCDLEKHFDLATRYDAVITIEVAEHLAPERADSFVDDLCRHADTVVFSAAIPGQGGKGHKNEQWQSYWAEKFEARGFATFDVFRPNLLRDPGVLPWFRQNILLFAKDGSEAAKAHQACRIPVQSADMIVPEHHRKILKRTRRRLRGKLDAARRALVT